MTKNIDKNGLTDTERTILSVAEQEFLTKGFEGARTTSIAEAAGVTHAMLHYYFRTKKALFDRIVTEKISLLKELLLTSVDDSELSLEQMLRNIIERHIDFLAANPLLPRFITNEINSGSERAEALLKKIHDFAPMMVGSLQMKIDREAAEGRCRKVDARMLMLDIVSLNIFFFIAAPIAQAAFPYLTENTERFLALRKKENFETIMRKLKV